MKINLIQTLPDTVYAQSAILKKRTDLDFEAFNQRLRRFNRLELIKIGTEALWKGKELRLRPQMDFLLRHYGPAVITLAAITAPRSDRATPNGFWKRRSNSAAVAGPIVRRCKGRPLLRRRVGAPIFLAFPVRLAQPLL